MKKIHLLLCAFVLCISCQEEKTTGLVTEKAMVVSAREEASQIGANILKKGGNAFDAMIATHFAPPVISSQRYVFRFIRKCN